MFSILHFSPILAFGIAGGAIGLLLMLALIIIGFLIIVFVVKLLFFFLPAAIIALIVWWITHEPLYTGIAFLLVALISLVKR